jgi:hypothetical protein
MNSPTSVKQLQTVTGNVKSIAEAALADNGGLFRLAPCWVPRSFLQPGKRLKLDPRDLYAFGLNRGGIDERWFGSTTEAANDNRTPDEGLSYVTHAGKRFTLKSAVDELGGRVIGDAIWNKYKKWPVYSKFFDNMGPIPHHMHQSKEQAALVGRRGSRRATTSRRSTTTSGTTSPTRSWASSRAPPRPRSASRSRTGTRGTTASSTCPRRTA